MPSQSRDSVIRIGLVAEEPVRIAGLASIFDEPPGAGQPRFVPVQGSATELLAGDAPKYMVVDLHAPPGFAALETIHQERPDIRLIVIGPRDDDLVMNSIIAGARAYLEPSDGPDTVRQAVEVVISGSIWAPRRLLSRLIDRLLNEDESKSAGQIPTMTLRERQVMEHILLARSNKEIAERLGIEERTVKAYVSRLMQKTGADNRVKLSISSLAQQLKKQLDAANEELNNGEEDY